MPEELPPEKLDKIAASILAGQKIEAIKTYRELTGRGLKESKEAVEEIEASLRASRPEAFANQTKGCLVALVLLGAGALALAALGQLA